MSHDVASQEVVTDRRVLQCNYAVDTTSVRDGARAYVIYPNYGNGGDRMMVLVRSRGGRWIETWVARTHLRDFRVKTLPPGHQLFTNKRIMDVTAHNWYMVSQLLQDEVDTPCPPAPAWAVAGSAAAADARPVPVRWSTGAPRASGSAVPTPPPSAPVEPRL